MSWEKMTVNHSELEAVKRTLDKLKVKYKLTTLGTVTGYGINDYYGRQYAIRKLTFKNTIVLERMLRALDCDLDDIIVSYEFKKGKEPKKWKIEITIDE